MPGSMIAVTVGGTDITSDCMLASASFETQMNALPGSFELHVKDPNETHSFTTGQEIVLTVDGVRLFGGYVLQISYEHAFDADNTFASPYKHRVWVLRGTDYNILFDKRVLRNTSNYLVQIPNVAGSTADNTVISGALTNYFDTPSGFDTTTHVSNVTTISIDGTSPWAYPQQGTTMRDFFDSIKANRAALYFIDANKAFHYLALETAESVWGFSDQPNYATISSGSVYQGSTYGFRELEAVEDGSVIVNDALIWGGSQWSGASGGTIFSRTQDSTSETTHGRWQTAETHFGDSNYAIQAETDARANAIVLGPPGADATNVQKGLRYPQWQFNFGWYATEVPSIGGVKQHLYPGQLVTIALNTFGVTEELPLRTLRMSFPTNAADGTTYVRFDGEFSLLTSDQYTLWGYLLTNRSRILNTSSVATVTNSSTSTVYGAYGTFTPSPAPNGTTTLFSLPFGYISGTLEVYLNGLLQRDGTDYTETSPVSGTFTMTTAPVSTDLMVATCRTLSS